MAFNKMFRERRPRLHAGLTAAEVATQREQTASLTFAGIEMGLLPADRFPRADLYVRSKETALVGRTARPEMDPTRTHRLRLDRYDERDFDELREAMSKDGLWLLPPEVVR